MMITKSPQNTGVQRLCSQCDQKKEKGVIQAKEVPGGTPGATVEGEASVSPISGQVLPKDSDPNASSNTPQSDSSQCPPPPPDSNNGSDCTEKPSACSTGNTGSTPQDGADGETGSLPSKSIPKTQPRQTSLPRKNSSNLRPQSRGKVVGSKTIPQNTQATTTDPEAADHPDLENQVEAANRGVVRQKAEATSQALKAQVQLHAINAETSWLTSTEINFALPQQKKTVAREDNSVKQQQQRAIATSMASSFLAQGAMHVQKVTALGQEILVQIQEESKGAVASVKATIEQQKAAVATQMSGQRDQAQSEAEKTIAYIHTRYQVARAAIPQKATKVRQQTETEYAKALFTINEGEREQLDQINKSYVEVCGQCKNVGQMIGAEAVAFGEEKATYWDKQKIHRDDDFWAGRLTDNRLQAKMDAAKKVAAQFKCSLINEANQQADEIQKQKPKDIQIAHTIAEQHRQQAQILQQHSLENLSGVEDQGLSQVTEAQIKLTETANQSLQSTLQFLNQEEAVQLQVLEGYGQRQILAIERDAQKAIASLQNGVNEIAASLQNVLENSIAQFQEMEAPNPEELSVTLANTLQRFDNAVVMVQRQTEKGIATSKFSVIEGGKQAVDAVTAIAQRGVEESATVVEETKTALAHLKKGTTHTFNEIQRGHTKTFTKSIEIAVKGFSQLKEGIQTTFEQYLKPDRFQQSLTSLEEALRGGIHGYKEQSEECAIKYAADKAADQVQPRWKVALKWIIIILVAIITIVVMVVFPPGGGLLGALLVGVLIGVVSGIVVQIINNAIDGKKWSDGVGQAALAGAIGGLFGGIGGALGQAVKIGVNIAKEVVKKALVFAVRFGIDQVFNALGTLVGDLAVAAIDHQPIDWKEIGKDIGIGAAMGVGSEGLGGAAHRSLAGISNRAKVAEFGQKHPGEINELAKLDPKNQEAFDEGVNKVAERTGMKPQEIAELAKLKQVRHAERAIRITKKFDKYRLGRFIKQRAIKIADMHQQVEPQTPADATEVAAPETTRFSEPSDRNISTVSHADADVAGVKRPETEEKAPETTTSSGRSTHFDEPEIEPGVVAKEKTADGHEIKVLKDGRIFRCTTCDNISKKYEKLLTENSTLKEQFENIEGILDSNEKSKQAKQFEKILKNIQNIQDIEKNLNEQKDKISGLEGEKLDKALLKLKNTENNLENYKKNGLPPKKEKQVKTTEPQLEISGKISLIENNYNSLLQKEPQLKQRLKEINESNLDDNQKSKSLDEFKKVLIEKSLAKRDNPIKLKLAEELENILNDLKIPAFLGGGGAAAVLGSGRNIKDLDYKMGQDFKQRWENKGERLNIVNNITSKLKEKGFQVSKSNETIDKELPYVLKLEVKPKDSNEAIEISLTSVGKYDEMEIQKQAGVTLIGRDLLILDKMFAFAERDIKSVDKLTTDFVDIVQLLNNYSPTIRPDALEIRFVAYRGKLSQRSNTGDNMMKQSIGEQILARIKQYKDAFVDAQKNRNITGGIERLEKFTQQLEKAARQEFLYQRDEIIQGTAPLKANPNNSRVVVRANSLFKKLTSKQKSNVLREWVQYNSKLKTLINSDSMNTQEYKNVSKQVAELNKKYNINLLFKRVDTRNLFGKNPFWMGVDTPTAGSANNFTGSRPDTGESRPDADVHTPGGRSDVGTETPKGLELDTELRMTAKEREILQKTAPKDGDQLTPEELKTEFEVAGRVERKQINEEKYVVEIQLPNGHKLKQRRSDGGWCRFTTPFCLPGKRAVVQIEIGNDTNVASDVDQSSIAKDPMDLDDVTSIASDTMDIDPPLVITKVNIGGRPPGLLGSKEGSHTTAWAVYTDNVRSAIIDKTPDEAIGQIQKMFQDASHLPGMTLVNELDKAALELHNKAKKNMEDFSDIDINTLEGNAKIPHLQKLVAAYLRFRNSVPFSQIDTGSTAKGHGEPKPIELLRKANDDLKNPNDLNDDYKKDVLSAIWDLFDFEAVNKLRKMSEKKQAAPGTYKLDDVNLIAIPVVQHIWSIQAAYSEAARAVDLDNNYKDFIKEKFDLLDEKMEKVSQRIEEIYETGKDPTTIENHPLLLRSTDQGKSRFAVQIINKGDKVEDVLVGDRPHGLLGSKEGSHTTAFVVVVDEVHTRLHNKSFDEALKIILAMKEQALELPGAKRVDKLVESARDLHEEALTDFKEKQEKMEEALSNPVLKLPLLQELVASYLQLRNRIPLSQVDAGLANASSEGKKRARIRYINGDIPSGQWRRELYQEAPSNSKDVLSDLWGMLDKGILEKMAEGHIEPEDAPGIDNKSFDQEVLVDVIKTHLITMERAYPVAYKQSEMGKVPSIEKFLIGRENEEVGMNYIKEFAEKVLKSFQNQSSDVSASVSSTVTNGTGLRRTTRISTSYRYNPLK